MDTASGLRTLPLIVDGDPDGPDLATALHAERPRIRRLLTEHGAVLLRGFPVGGVDGFGQAVRAFSGEPLTYAERSSPRSEIEASIYTSTDYPPEEEIFLHNENSYQASWPRLLFFYCDVPPSTLGATPLADIRRVHESVDPSVREEFVRRRWMVVRNFHEQFGSSWRYIFNTEDRAAVEAYCRGKDLAFEWVGADGLRTRAVRDAVHLHPDTGLPVWFNHITFFHHTTLPAEVREGLLELFGGEDRLPSNTYYGDGGRIPDDVVAHLRDCYRAASVRFDWQEGDMLVVDNMAAAHGREPFTGRRRIAVAMAEAYTPPAEQRRV
ncbi:TauD/TfdA family dioxygenase [Micromonospora sp. NPDC051300]|uniref:TauD/TfdA family dioxygenase n=1 Tax=Micromonospora sp. NPDC051300 TaxID=3364286 RepID=UPI00378D080B